MASRKFSLVGQYGPCLSLARSKICRRRPLSRHSDCSDVPLGDILGQPLDDTYDVADQSAVKG